MKCIVSETGKLKRVNSESIQTLFSFNNSLSPTLVKAHYATIRKKFIMVILPKPILLN